MSTTVNLTVHDLLSDQPAADLTIMVAEVDDNGSLHPIRVVSTDANGCPTRPLATTDDLSLPKLELLLQVGEFYRRLGVAPIHGLTVEELPLRLHVRGQLEKQAVTISIAPHACRVEIA